MERKCNSCKYRDTDGAEHPCRECLDHPHIKPNYEKGQGDGR